MARPAVLCALPAAEARAVEEELAGVALETIRVDGAEQAAAVLAERADVGLAIVDGDREIET